MNLEEIARTTLMKQVLKSPQGRAMLLAQTADAEDNGEAAMFDQALELVDDPRFQKMIERHQADEVSHGRLFRECAERQGVKVKPIPPELRALQHVDDACGGFFSRPLSSIDDVVFAYAVLQALEERALVQFPFYERLFRDFDPVTAEVFVEVAKDEERHLLYCRAITRQYARDEQALAEVLARARRLEAIAFRKTEHATAAYIDREQFIANPIVRAVWRAVSRVENPPRPAVELLVA